MSKGNKIILPFILILATATSCKKPSTGSLEIKAKVSTTNALPIPLSSCMDILDGESDSLTEASVDFSKIEYAWRGSKNFVISYIHVSVVGSSISGGSYSIDIGSDELEAIFSGTGLSLPGVASPGDATLKESSCSIRMGGIPFLNPKVPGSATATITVLGVETDDNGQSTPVTGEVQIFVDYNGKP